MADLKINGNHDILFDPTVNDLVIVNDFEAAQQRLAAETIALFHNEIGSADSENVLERTELLAGRVAADIDGLLGVLGFSAFFDDEDASKVNVRVHFATTEDFEFPLNQSEDE